MLRGNFQAAVDTQIKAVRTNRDNVLARRYLGYSLLRVGAPDDAIEQLWFVTRMTNPNALDLYLCGEAYLRTHRYDYAEMAFNDALDLDQNFLLAKGGLVKIMIAQNKYDEALKTCESELRTGNKDKQEFFQAFYAAVQDARTKFLETAKRKETTSPNEVEEVGTTSNLPQPQSNLSVQTVGIVSNVQNVQNAQIAPHQLGNNQSINAWAEFKGLQKK